MSAALGTTWRFRSADANAGVAISADGRTATVVGSGGTRGARGTFFEVSSSKWYVEARAVVAGGPTMGIGIGDVSQSTGIFVGQSAHSCGYHTDGSVYVDGVVVASYANYTAGDVIGYAIDQAASKIWFSKNGVWQSGDPIAGTGGAAITAATYYPMVAAELGGVWTIPIMLGQPPPAGFAAR